MIDATTFRLDTVDLASEFGWDVEHLLRMDEFTKGGGVTILVQYLSDDSITSITRSRPDRADEIYSEDSPGKNERLRMWLTGRRASTGQPERQKVRIAAADKVPKLSWSREGWMHRGTGEVVKDDDPRVPQTVDASKRDRDWMLTGSQAYVVGSYYRRDLDQSTGQTEQPLVTATWHPDGGPTVELARAGGHQAYRACVDHYQSNWSPAVARLGQLARQLITKEQSD